MNCKTWLEKYIKKNQPVEPGQVYTAGKDIGFSKRNQTSAELARWIYKHRHARLNHVLEVGSLRENQIEARLVQGVKARGGLCLKFTSPGSPGVPDRIVITPKGRVCFVELKTETGRLAKIQQWMIGELKNRDVEVFVVKGSAEVTRFLEEVMPNEV